jgi:lysozyme
MSKIPQNQNNLTKNQLEALLRARLYENEGKKRSAYQDSLGYWTIGCGRLIDARKNGGLSDVEIDYLLTNDIQTARNDLQSYSWYQKQDQVRKDVLVELCFNLGLAGLLGFKKMIGALDTTNYKLAVAELLDSKWATQVGNDRINDLVYRLKNGAYQ